MCLSWPEARLPVLLAGLLDGLRPSRCASAPQKTTRHPRISRTVGAGSRMPVRPRMEGRSVSLPNVLLDHASCGDRASLTASHGKGRPASNVVDGRLA